MDITIKIAKTVGFSILLAFSGLAAKNVLESIDDIWR